jgi:hypothetical protein
MSSLKDFGFVRQCLLDSLLKDFYLRLAPLLHLVMLDRLPDRFDLRQLGTVRRQVQQRNVGRCEFGARLLHQFALVNRVVVQHNHQRTNALPAFQIERRTTGEVSEEGDQARSVYRADFLH